MSDKKKLPKNSAGWNTDSPARYSPPKPSFAPNSVPSNLRLKCTGCGAEFEEARGMVKFELHVDRDPRGFHIGFNMLPQGGKAWEGNTTRVWNNTGKWQEEMIEEETQALGYRPHWA
jgi:hypothetical protein